MRKRIAQRRTPRTLRCVSYLFSCVKIPPNVLYFYTNFKQFVRIDCKKKKKPKEYVCMFVRAEYPNTKECKRLDGVISSHFYSLRVSTNGEKKESMIERERETSEKDYVISRKI